MASSKASNAGSSYKEQREQKVLDVMFLCDEWKSSKGGLSTFNREFAINLAQATTGSMTIHCYVSNSDDRDREDAKQHGVNLITARSVPGSTDRLEGLKFSSPELPNPHLVIGHGRKLGCPAYSLLQNTKCKWIQFVHVYCEDLGKYKESATAAEDTIEENEKKHKMEIELCEAADAVVAVGSRLQRKYSRRLLNVEVKIITPGIFGRFSNESKLAVDRSVVKNFNVSLFGRAAFEDLSLKGYDVVANAIGSLGENFELTFVGSSPGEQRKVEQWFLDNTCINRNQLTIRRYCSEQEELKMMFYQSDLVALPSRTEGFGLVALEAISAGVPVLVSSESGIAEALQKVDGGNTVIVGSGENEDKWARRIREMYGESAEEREAKAVKLRENYRKVYSWKAECERFKGLIENVMETANGGEMNINVDVDDLKPEEQNMQTGMLATESVRCQEVQQPRASATSAASGSVSYSQKEDLNALEKKIFLSIVQNYLQTTPPQSPEEHSRFMEYTQKMRLIITGVAVGSLVITVKCESLKILEELWTDYSSGHLGEVVQKCFVTEKILKELNLAELRLKTTMDIEEYNACKMFFEKDALRDALSSEFHTTSSTSESPQKKEQWEKSEQKTKIMETVKLEGASSSEFHYTSSTSESPQKQEELKKWKQKTKIVETEKLKGTLPITVIPTTGRGIELIGRAQGRKGMLPLLGSSTSDPEEELEELRMKLQIMKDASSSEFHSISSTSESPQNQKELKKLKQKTKIVETEKPKGTSTLTVIPTTGRGKELIEKGQGRKGSSPPPPLSTTDFEEKLAKVCEEIKMLRMEGTLPPPELLNLEKELKQLTELFTQKKEERHSRERKLRVTLLSAGWKASSNEDLTTINRELAIQMAKHPNVEVSILLPQCSEEDKKDADTYNVKLIEAVKLSGFEPVDWLASVPEGHAMDCVLGHGLALGRQIQIIKKNPNYSHCKWIQVVHTLPEEIGMYKSISEGQKMQQTEIELCEMAHQVVTIGPKLTDAYENQLGKGKVFNLMPSILTEFSDVQQASNERRTFCVLVTESGDSEDFYVKGYNVAVKAIANLKDKSYQLIIASKQRGKEDELADKLLQCGIGCNQLIICSFDENKETLANLFSAVDIAILPSKAKGFGLRALEAISAGLPVLVSGNSGIAEALRKVPSGSQCIVDSEDPAEWARAIKAVRYKERNVRLAEARILREYYLQQFSWEEPCNFLVEKMYSLAFGGELNIKVDVEEIQQPGASATSTASGSVSCPKTVDLQSNKEEIFLSIVRNYFQATQPQSIEEFERFLEYAKKMELIITGVTEGSLLITVKCESRMILEELWTDYSSGHLGEVVQNCFVTEKILKELNLAELRLKTTMDIEEYNACKMFFEKDALGDALPPEFHSTSSTSEGSLIKERWEKSEQQTKIMEMAKLEGMLPLPGSYTSDPEEELEELRVKFQIMKGSSPPPLLSTTDLEEKLGQVCQEIQKLRMEGSFPVVKFSTIDLEEKLAEQSMELKRLRMEGTLPSPELFHADLEEELKQLPTELFRQRVKGSSPPPIIEMKLKELLQKLQKWRMEGE